MKSEILEIGFYIAKCYICGWDSGCPIRDLARVEQMLQEHNQEEDMKHSDIPKQTVEMHYMDCGEVGGGWPHPASAHEGN